MDTQNRQILQWLQDGHALTPLEALRKFGCLRLSARIKELRDLGRDLGFEIDTGKKQIIDRNGRKKIVAEYSLKGVPYDG